MKMIEQLMRAGRAWLAQCSETEFKIVHSWLTAFVNALPGIRARERREELSEANVSALKELNEQYDNVRWEVKSDIRVFYQVSVPTSDKPKSTYTNFTVNDDGDVNITIKDKDKPLGTK